MLQRAVILEQGMKKRVKNGKMKTWRGWVLVNDDGHMCTYVLEDLITDRKLLECQRWARVEVRELTPKKARQQ